MTLAFPDPPRGVDPTTIEVRLFGRDTETRDYVECRVTHKALMEHCGACGETDQELLRAFEEHRTQIEDACRRKYAAGRVEDLEDRIVVRLGSADL